MNVVSMPSLRKARVVLGRHLVLRNAEVSDAAFIHELRTDPVRARHLSAVPDRLQAQVDWLERYAQDPNQAYFMICAFEGGKPLGTVRLYAARATTFSWGSWLLRAGLPPRCAIESALIVYRYALALGFDRACFEVRAGNASVWRFHENFGARRTDERQGQYVYELAPQALFTGLKKYHRYLPEGIRIHF